MEKEFFDLKEVCALVKRSSSTVLRWVNAGLFDQPLTGRGKKMLWSKSQLEAWANRYTPPVNTPPVTSPTKQKQLDKDKKRRLAAARASLERHRNAK